MKNISEDRWIHWLDELAQNDYVIVDNFIGEELFQSILTLFKELQQEQEFVKAGIGAQQNHQIQSTVRGDLIYWLNRRRDEAMEPFFGLMEELVARLRRYCFLSIADYEFHLAHYPAGTRYERHVDQFHGRTNRMITVLIYLNENWQPSDGGELIIYKDGGEISVAPLARRLLLFKSDSIEHEVLLTHTGRMSLTGWLLHQPASLGYLMS